MEAAVGLDKIPPKEPVSPWGKTVQPESSNFADIMSEQLAMDIHLKQEERFAQKFGMEITQDLENVVETPVLPGKEDLGLDRGLEPLSVQACESDRVIAEMLQRQFDREYDDILKQTENKFNGTSKVSISFSNYRSVHDAATIACDSDSDTDEQVVDDKHQDWDSFTASEKEFKSIPRCGYKKQSLGVGMVTKHDAALSNRRNACKVMSFPPEIQTGDGGGFDMQLSNKVFNSLKAHSRHVSSRRNRIHDKSDAATAEMGLDEKTRLILFKLVNQGLLDQVNGILSTGKEAVILHADGGQVEETIVPKECAIKVFKTTLNEFKTRDKYIQDDYRFKDRFSKQNPRKIIHLWAEKEMHNLNRMRKYGIRCPEVVTLKKHVLVMSFIGEDHRPARKLKDAPLDAEDLHLAYEQVCQSMKTLYNLAELVHADLSEYNILWHNRQCWLIDVSQAVERNHPRAMEFLHRDCVNVCTFFKRKGYEGTQSPAQLFETIAGIDSSKLTETDSNRAAMLARVRDYERNNELLTHDCSEKIYPFDYCWDQSKQEQT